MESVHPLDPNTSRHLDTVNRLSSLDYHWGKMASISSYSRFKTPSPSLGRFCKAPRKA